MWQKSILTKYTSDLASQVIITFIWLTYIYIVFFLDGYNANEMVYQWEDRPDKGIAVAKRTRDMPQYNLTKITARRYFTMYFSGKKLVVLGLDSKTVATFINTSVTRAGMRGDKLAA